jgi:beta-phosphoglucomutase
MDNLLILDIDGTVIDTPHCEAWQWAAAQLEMPTLTCQEYADHVAGLPRIAGAKEILRLNRADPNLAIALSDIKQRRLLELDSEILFFPDAERLVERAVAASIPVVFYTASLNAATFLKRAFAMSKLGECNAHLYVQSSSESRLALIKRVREVTGCGRKILVDDTKHSAEIASMLDMVAYQICRDSSQIITTNGAVRVIASLDEVELL